MVAIKLPNKADEDLGRRPQNRSNGMAREGSVGANGHSTMGKSDLTRLHKGKPNTRDKIWAVMDSPQSSRLAKVWSALIMITILVSSVAFIVASLPQYVAEDPAIFGLLEYICVIIFTIEYVLRWCTAPSWYRSSSEKSRDVETPVIFLRERYFFMMSWMNMVDLVAIVPFYVELLLEAIMGEASGDASALAVVRVVRITRVFRLLKLGKNNEGMEILALTMKESSSFLVSVLFLVIIFQVLFGALVFYAESGSLCVISWQCVGGAGEGQECTLLQYQDGSTAVYNASLNLGGKQGGSQPSIATTVPNASLPNSVICGEGSTCKDIGNMCFNNDGQLTKFNSIPVSMWWTLVTMCCVGFGDLYPVTDLGRVLGAITAITGVIVLAMPTTVIGTNFSEIFEDYHSRHDNEDEDEGSGDSLPEELKGANSKHLNRLIVEKQIAAKAQGNGIPAGVVEAAFSSAESKAKEKGKQILDVFRAFAPEWESQEEWKDVKSRALLASREKVSSLMNSR